MDMNSKPNFDIRNYLIEHCIDPDELPNNIRVHNVRNEIEIRVTDQDSFLLFSKYRVLDGDIKYRYDKGAKMALFNSKSLKNDGDVYIVEGEFDAIALNTIYPVVVSSTGGCNSWRPEWTELLKGRDVKICFDNDRPGILASISLYKKLLGNVKSVEILLLNDTNDVCEHIYNNRYFKPSVIVDSEIGVVLTEQVTSKAQVNRMQSFIENTVYHETYRDGLLDIVSDIYRSKYRPKTYTEGERTSVEQVRQVPITDYVNFKGGVACCVFHSERNPSMYYNDFSSAYPNTVKCYSCGKFGDVIDVVMSLENVGFKDALNLLKGN